MVGAFIGASLIVLIAFLIIYRIFCKSFKLSRPEVLLISVILLASCFLGYFVFKFSLKLDYLSSDNYELQINGLKPILQSIVYSVIDYLLCLLLGFGGYFLLQKKINLKK